MPVGPIAETQISHFMGIDNTCNLIDNIAAEAGIEAFAFESFRNSLRSLQLVPFSERAISLRVDEVEYDRTLGDPGGPLKHFAILDRGAGMDAATLRRFADLSSSSDKMGLTGARGLGVRVALLAKGFCTKVRAYSWPDVDCATCGSEEAPVPCKGHQIQLIRACNAEGVEKVGAVDFNWEDDEGEWHLDIVAPAPDEYAEFLRRTFNIEGRIRGTIIVAEGGPGTRNSVRGPGERGGVRIMQTSIVRRMHAFPGGDYTAYEEGSKEAPSSKFLYRDAKGEEGRYGAMRQLESVQTVMNRTAKRSVEKTLSDGTLVQLWYAPWEPDLNHPKKTPYREQVTNAHSVSLRFNDTSGLIWLNYQEDSFREIYRTFPGGRNEGWYHAFGISNAARNLLFIAVTPPRAEFDSQNICTKAGVAPNLARSELSYFQVGRSSHEGESDRNFPWQAWGQEFKNLSPGWVRKVVADHASTDISFDEIMSRLADEMRREDFQDMYSGGFGSLRRTPKGDGAGEGEKQARGKKGGKPKGSGGGSGNRRVYVDFLTGESPWLVSAGARVLLIHTESPFFDEEIAYYRAHVTSWSDEAETKLRNSMYFLLAVEMNHYYLNINTRRKRKEATKDDETAAFNNHVLTAHGQSFLRTARDLVRRSVYSMGWTK